MSRRWVTCAVNSATIAEGSRGHRSHRQEVPAYARAVDDNESRSPSRQHCQVRLGKRTDPDRDLLKFDEQSFQRVAKLPLDTSPRLSESHRLRYDPRPSQLGGHVGWDQVAADREEASQLRERRSQLFEGEAQPRAHPLRLFPTTARQQAAPEHEAETVARPDAGDPGRPAGWALRQIPRYPLHR